jgi:hypothetical protein
MRSGIATARARRAAKRGDQEERNHLLHESAVRGHRAAPT